MSRKETILDFEKNDGIAISDLFNIFKNNFKLFSIITSLITLLSVIYSLMLTPIFQAEVVAIAAEKTASSSGSLVSGVTGMARLAGISKNNYQTIEEYALLLSTRYPIIKPEIYKITNAHKMEKYSGQSTSLVDLQTPWDIIKSHILKDFIKRIFQWTQKNDTIKSN